MITIDEKEGRNKMKQNERKNKRIQHLATHQHVDLDAVSSILVAKYFSEKPVKVLFYPANVTDEEIPEGVRPLDIASGKGNGSALASMSEAANCPQKLIDEVEEQDTSGKVDQPRFSLPEIFSAIRLWTNREYEKEERCQNTGKYKDYDIIDMWEPIIHGLLIMEEEKRKARKAIEEENFEIHEIGGFKIVVGDRSLTPEEGKIFNEMGVHASIYCDPKPEHNMGIFRFPGNEAPDLRKLEEHLPGWFIHKSGFLAAWGSRKAPAKTNPPQGTPQTKEELLGLLMAVYQES